MKIRYFTFLLFVFIFLNRPTASAQITNGGFENWSLDVDGNLNPNSWETTNELPDTSVLRYSPGYVGNYSMLVRTFNPGFMVVPGIANISFPFSLRPTQFRACVKTKVMTGDMCFLMMALLKGDSSIAALDSCTFKIDSSMTQFRCFNFPIKYISNFKPDTAMLFVIAGGYNNAKIGTQIIVDELSFVFGNGINETVVPISAFIGKSYPNPTSSYTSIPLKLTSGSPIMVNIYDLSGKKITTLNQGFLQAGAHLVKLNLDALSNGIYSYTVEGNDFILQEKLIVNK